MADEGLLDCVFGADGFPIRPGDMVRPVVDKYYWRPSETRKVIKVMQPDDIHGARLTAVNPSSPYGTSDYTAGNFVVTRKSRHKNAFQQYEELSNMASPRTVNVAYEIGNMTYDQVIAAINDGVFPVASVMANTSAEALKERIRQRIQSYPTERWIICSGTVIGEISAPPVRFRSA